MAKEALKRKIAEEQGGVDPITGETLAPVPRLVDTDRMTPKAEGGTYDERDNVRVLDPVSHMRRHGTLREREERLEAIKSLFDDRVQVMRLKLKINNQLLAYQRRTDQAHPETEEFLKEQLGVVDQRLKQIDRPLARTVTKYDDALVQSALGVKGLGPVTIAALTVYVDLAGVYGEGDRSVKEGSKQAGQEKCPHASSLWRYVGLDKASHERYTKGIAGGGNKILRTVLWNNACVFVKLGEGPYREVYDRVKARLAASEKVVKTRNTEGHLVEAMWKDAKPSHRHGAALRAVMKHLLADYWYVGRVLAGLPVTEPYVQDRLGHQHIISPRDRGWSF